MALARVVVFEGVDAGRMEEMKTQIGGEPPPGVPATELMLLHDPAGQRATAIIFFDNEEDYRQGDEVLNAIPSAETPGSRASVTKHEVAVRMTA